MKTYRYLLSSVIILLLLTAIGVAYFNVFSIVSLQESLLEPLEIQEDEIWAANQIQVEYYKLQKTLFAELITPVEWSEVKVRYEILLSRLDLFQSGLIAEKIAQLPKAQMLLQQLLSNLEHIEPLINQIDEGKRELLSDVSKQLLPSETDINRFVRIVNETKVENTVQERFFFQDTFEKIKIYFATLLLAATTLIGLLFWLLWLMVQAHREADYQRNVAEKNAMSKSQFLANMSHEIRTPLNAIIGLTHVLINHADKSHVTDFFKQHLIHIHISAQHLLELINNILDLSKIEVGKMPLNEENFRVQNLAEELFTIYKFPADQKNITLLCDLDSSLPTVVYADQGKLNQILMNLIGNAIKFSPAHKKVILQVAQEDQRLVFQVIDEGIGIPPERKEAIFQDFEQADGTITRGYGGSGLGLSIAKKFVDLMQGHIHVDSNLGKGSTFKVSIPLVEGFLPQANLQKDFYENHRLFSKNNTILVVEDNLMNQVTIEALLNDLGLRVHFADNGKLGINKALALQAEGHIPDLIFMDLHMPTMSGLEASQKILAEPELQHIPIVALSADIFSENQEKANSIGISDYLTKPIDMKKLMPILEKYLRHE